MELWAHAEAACTRGGAGELGEHVVAVEADAEGTVPAHWAWVGERRRGKRVPGKGGGGEGAGEGGEEVEGGEGRSLQS